ncbi:hypothetical protein E4U41_005565 [Claviceps citrina]|nr:hypothetical protein E4U41_005565 [Claviceps citrina]
MSLPPVPHVFDTGLRTFHSRSGSLDMLVRQHLEFAALDVGMMNTPPPGSDSLEEDIVSEIGDYFTRTAMLWARLTEQLAHGTHIVQASHRAHERSKAVSHLSDLSEVARVDVNIAKLRRIKDLSLKFSQEVQEAWCTEPTMMNRHHVLQASMPPFCEAKFPTMAEGAAFTGDSNPPHFASRKLLPETGHIGHDLKIITDVSGSESSSDDDEDDQFQSIDMDALRQRGKGVYLCPKGLKCDKGGVDKDGNLVVFDRNSSFAQHCNKHRKPWRCDVPGCPNPPKKRRFARRDGLERHKTTVKHYLVT